MLQQRVHLAVVFDKALQLRPVLDHAALLALVDDAFHLLVVEVWMADQSLEIGAIDVDFAQLGLTYYYIRLDGVEACRVHALHVPQLFLVDETAQLVAERDDARSGVASDLRQLDQSGRVDRIDVDW